MAPRGYRYSLDPFLLADFVRFPAKARWGMDFGTGSGILLYLLRKKEPLIRYIGLEKQESLIHQAQQAKKDEGIESIFFVCGNIQAGPRLFPCHAFDLILSNPPYRKKGSGRISPDPEKAAARHEIAVTMQDILGNASLLLRDLGRLFLIYHPSRLEELLSGMERATIHPERIRFVHGSRTGEATMILAEGVKNGKGFLKVETPLFVYGKKGEYSSEMKEIYRMHSLKQPAHPEEETPD